MYYNKDCISKKKKTQQSIIKLSLESLVSSSLHNKKKTTTRARGTTGPIELDSLTRNAIGGKRLGGSYRSLDDMFTV